MSTHHTECAALTELPAARKLVLMALCDSADKTTGIAWPGLEMMMAWSNLHSKSQVMAHLKALEDDGYIARVSRGRKGKRAVFRVWDQVPCCGLHEQLGEPRKGSGVPDFEPVDNSRTEVRLGSGTPENESIGSGIGSGIGYGLGRTPSVSSVSSSSIESSYIVSSSEPVDNSPLTDSGVEGVAPASPSPAELTDPCKCGRHQGVESPPPCFDCKVSRERWEHNVKVEARQREQVSREREREERRAEWEERQRRKQDPERQARVREAMEQAKVAAKGRRR